MSLYDDLPPVGTGTTAYSAMPVVSKEEENAKKSSEMEAKMLAQAALRRKTAQNQAKPKAPPVKAKATVPSVSKSSSVSSSSTPLTTHSIIEEQELYDPMYPNDYEQLIQERKTSVRDKPSSKVNADFKPPAIYQQDDDVTPMHTDSSKSSFTKGNSSTEEVKPILGGSNPAVAKMMAKMGYKEGQGLGKNEQGITSALLAKKTDVGTGIIVNVGMDTTSPEKPITETHVVLLTNVIDPVDMDNELEQEITTECNKYGTVLACTAYLDNRTHVPIDEAVRIYVKFSTTQGASKAVGALDGRLFGGRNVRAKFFSEEMYEQKEFSY